MTTKVSELEQPLRSVENERTPSITRRIEAAAWGAPIWWLACRLLQRRVSKRFDAIDAKNKKVRTKSRAIEHFVIQLVDFGRLLSRPAKKHIRKLHAVGVPTLLIRDSVTGRLISNKTGSLELDGRRSRLLLVLGLLWCLIATGISMLLGALAISLPGAALAKGITVFLIVIVFVYSIGLITPLTIRRFLAHQYLSKLKLAPFPAPKLRALT